MDHSLEPPASPLVRGLGLRAAVALNVSNMVGAGPFITIPSFLAAMGGPHALVAWVLAAALVMCDGLVWSELGAALPGSGGSYHFLQRIYGPYRWGRLMPFLFIWQFLITGALELATGYIAAAQFLADIFPALSVPILGVQTLSPQPFLAAAIAIVVTGSLCRRIDSLGRISVVLCSGAIVTVLTVIVLGLIHFDRRLIAIPDDAWRWDQDHLRALGGAMIIAIYDYLGYYNVCHLGDEVRDPARTIPRAVMLSILIVAALYLTMNVAIIGVVPWQEAAASKNIAADFMDRLLGRTAAVSFTAMILFAIVACVFAMTLGYSRILFAAARNGDFFRPLGYLHSRGRYPLVSLLVIGALTAAFCFFPLQKVIVATVTIRIPVQFIGQIVGLHVLRSTRPEISLPFRMWAYPLPSLAALLGWIFILGADVESLWVAAAVLTSGVLAFFAWQAFRESRGSGPSRSI